jgi:peptidoglycan/LPS O-acetylase OafA/YrhL
VTTLETEEAPRVRLDALTGMRFLAAAAVVLFHVGQLWHHPLPRPLTDYGHLGVPFFFVLSGFVLTWGRSDQRGRTRFLWNRFARIWPVHATCLLLAATQITVLGGHVTAGSATLSALLLQAWSPHRDVVLGMNPVAWTLSCEAAFYLAFPALVRAASRLDTAGRRTAVAGVVALQALTASVLVLVVGGAAGLHWALYAPVPVQGLSFALGVLTALSLRDGWATRVPVPVVLAVGGASLVVLRHLLAAQPEPAQRPLLDVVASVAACLLIARTTWCAQQGRRQLLAVPWAVRLGDWSYALYLVHVIVMYLVLNLGFRSTASALAAAGVSVVAAAALFHLVEHPLERWLRARPPSSWRRELDVAAAGWPEGVPGQREL